MADEIIDGNITEEGHLTKGAIKITPDVFPVTVIDAVAVGDGTNKMLKDYLEENYKTYDWAKEQEKPTYTAEDVGAISAEQAEQGQIPIANGDGTITWTTIQNAEGASF